MIPQDRLIQITQRFQYLEAAMADGSGDIAALAKEYSDLKPVVDQIAAYSRIAEDLAAAEASAVRSAQAEVTAVLRDMRQLAESIASRPRVVTSLAADSVDAGALDARAAVRRPGPRQSPVPLQMMRLVWPSTPSAQREQMSGWSWTHVMPGPPCARAANGPPRAISTHAIWGST